MWADQGFDGSAQRSVHFCIDDELIYTAFFADFGPLNLGLTYTFCRRLDGLLKEQEAAGGTVTLWCSKHEHRKANAAVLLQAYLIFVRGYSVEDAYAPLIGIEPPFCTFRDAAFAINSFPITVLDCSRAFHRAVSNKHFDYQTFDLEAFQNLNKYENGDISWIIPNKLIAFSGPLSTRRELGNGVYSLLPQEYVPIFRRLNVTCVIRFNNKCYDRKVFTKAGIRHVDLFYEDGGNPTESILQSFLQICEQERGAIAVHCKAGLGRTGTNIAAYMMKHYGYTAKESTAWCRVCRPGSVVGPQQQFLAELEPRMFMEGQRYRTERAKLQLGRENNVPPIGKTPAAASSTNLWAGSADSSQNKTGRPLNLPTSQETERRPSTGGVTGSASRGTHRSHAYHELPSARPTSRPVIAQEHALRRVKSQDPDYLSKSFKIPQPGGAATTDGQRPSTSGKANGNSGPNKMRSSIDSSPYKSTGIKRVASYR